MTTLATDSFTRANAATLGANWTDIDAGWGIASNAADCTPAAAVYTSRYTGVAFPNNQWAQVIITGTAEANTDQGSGPSVRMQAGGNIYFLQGNTVETRIYKRVSGGFTQLGTDGPAIAVSDVLYLEIQGTQLIAKKNGTIICGSPTDAAIASGNAGLWGAPVGVHGNVDDFSAGDFVVASTTPPQLGRCIYVMP